jgi:hypothetical protein
LSKSLLLLPFVAVPSAPSSWPQLCFRLHAKLATPDGAVVIARCRLTPYAFCLCARRGQAQRGPRPPTCHRPGLLPPRWLELMFKNKGSASSHPWSSPCRAGWTEDCSSRVLSFSPSHRPSRPPDASTSLAVGSGPLLTVGHHPRPAHHTIQLRPEQRRRATHASSGPPLSSFGSGVSHPRHKGESNRAGRRDGEGSSFAKFG